jgi:ADP-heptose:LPS heptosyltransferase
MMAGMEPQRLLIIRDGGLGDGLLLWPALAAVRRRCPQARIDLMGRAERLALLVGPGGADRALSAAGTGLHRLLDYGCETDAADCDRFAGYDAVVAFSARGDCALGENLAACGVREVHVFLPFPPEQPPQHAAAYVLEALQQAELAEPGPLRVPPLPRPAAAAAAAAAERLQATGLGAGRPLALLAPGSGSERKNWPPARWAELAGALRGAGWQLGLVQGPADGAAVAAVQAAGAELPVLADAAPVELAALLAVADLLVGNDAGPSHLAGLLGVAVVALFGPTAPERWQPLGERVAVLAAADGRLESLAVERVWAACEDFRPLDSRRRPCL